MSSILSDIRRIPPVTRFLSGSLLGVSVLYMLEIVSRNVLIYRFHTVLQSYQVWRFYTSFFVGNSNLFFLFELLMLYNTSSQLESGYDSADLAWQLFFACAAIMVLLLSARLNSPEHPQVPSHFLATTVFLHPLMHCIAYLLSARTPVGESLSCYFITLPARYLPHAMLLIEILTGGREAVFQALVGVAVGYLWWRAVWGSEKGAAWARAPKWAKNSGSGVVNGCEKAVDGIASVFRCCQRRSALGGGSGNDHNWGSGQALENA
ncbi:Der1-like family-domain-containing protein [Armillaria novae-zelandiae]|uniref:Derlin n=1 Tax=Armillaria novae-zelandiae TaxID=153914 RepID=A0AA39PR36_9AGAR|nr:Der1-like family-domain-containing protein [Armillaria novae-zelandiae]